MLPSTRSVWLRAVDPMSRVLYIPWGLAFLSYSLDESWPKVVASYGLLCASLTIGRLIGRNWIFSSAQRDPRTYQPWIVVQHCMIVAISYIVIAFSTRYILFFVCHFFIGLSSSCLGAITNANNSKFAWNRARNKPEGHLHVSSTVLAFLPLCSGLFYNTSIHSRFPCFWPCILYSCLCITLAIPYILNESHQHRHRLHVPLEGLGGGGDTSSHDSFTDSSSDVQRNPTQRNNSNQNQHQDPSEGYFLTTAPIPSGYLNFHKGDKEVARKAYLNTLRWRRQHNVDRLLNGMHPQPGFEPIIQNYPHYIHGKSKDGCIVVYEVKILNKITIISFYCMNCLYVAYDRSTHKDSYRFYYKFYSYSKL